MKHLELKHPEEYRKCQLERGKELEVKKEKLDQKVALSLNETNEGTSSSRTPNMDSRQFSKMLSEYKKINKWCYNYIPHYNGYSPFGAFMYKFY